MPDQMVTRLRIAGWKSIRDAALDLRPITVLIGANGSGKSNLVAFFRLLNDLVGERLQAHIGKCGGANAVLHLGAKSTPLLECELHFRTLTGESRYVARWAAAAGDRLVFTDERIVFRREGWSHPLEKSLDAGHWESALKAQADVGEQTAGVIRRLLSRCRVFHFHDTSDSSAMRRACYIDANRHLYPDGGNVAAMLYAYREAHPTVYQRIVATVRLMAPFIDDFVLEPERLQSQQIALKWRQSGSDYEFGPHQLSDGTLRMIALTTLLLQPEADLPLLIALDEPELGLHPAAIHLLSDLVRKVSHHCQVVLATQSTVFVDCFELAEIVIASTDEGATSLLRPDPEQLQEWLDDYTVSELWEKNVFGGGPYS